MFLARNYPALEFPKTLDSSALVIMVLYRLFLIAALPFRLLTLLSGVTYAGRIFSPRSHPDQDMPDGQYYR